MSPKVEDGLSYTKYGYPSFLYRKDDRFTWISVDDNLRDITEKNFWHFIPGEDEHLVEGAALVAPLTMLFWEMADG